MTGNKSLLSKEETDLFRKELAGFKKDKNSFLKLVTRGQELSLQGKFVESNECFEKAYLILAPNENELVQYERYTFEYEIFMLLYLKALNYHSLNQPDEVVVESNRMKDWLSKDSASHHHHRVLFKDEPLPHMLLGIVYECQQQYNDAFIEYKLAYDLYQANYLGFFGVESPRQLQKAIVSAAFNAGLRDDYKDLCEEYGIKESVTSLDGGELVFIWHTGVGPYQQEEPAEFEINANSLTGKFVNSTSGVNYKFETAFQINLWKHNGLWTSLPPGIYYTRIPLRKGLNKFELTVFDICGGKKIVPMELIGNGKNQVRVYTSFESENTCPDVDEIIFTFE